MTGADPEISGHVVDVVLKYGLTVPVSELPVRVKLVMFVFAPGLLSDIVI